MSQLIIYQYKKANGFVGVATCYPTGAVSIETVLADSCPPEAIIIDSSVLPQGADAEFYDAWVLNGNTVSVDFSQAQALKLAQYNLMALEIAQKRNLNTLSGVANEIDDETWLAKLTLDRKNIASATTTAQLVAIELPTLTAA